MKKIVALMLALMLVLGSVSFAAADEIKNFKDYQTQANEMETFCYHYSQAAVDLNVLSNCYEHLLTNDAAGALVPAAAKAWSSPDGGQTWTFELNEDIVWVDYTGEYMADCIAEDWATGLEWVLNYHKNQSANTSMPIEMIKGAGEYYEYTKTLTEEEARLWAWRSSTRWSPAPAPMITPFSSSAWTSWPTSPPLLPTTVWLLCPLS